MSVTAGVSDTVIAVRDKLRGKIGQTKVKRYWPGKAPEWADDADEDGDIRMSAAASLEKAFPTQEYSDVVRKDDPRLRRLAESRIDNREDVRADHRRIRQAEIVSTIEEEAKRQEGLEAEEEDADALEERRRRIKEKLRQREQEEAPLLLSEDEEEVKEEEEEESEYDTDSEEELTGMVMLKPVFVPKSERDTIAERERLEAEFNFYFSPTDLFWYWDPYYYRRRRPQTDDNKMKFVESIFSFVFGDGDPNQGIEEERWKLIGQYIASNGGVVAAEELAPYLDVETSGGTLNDETYILPVLLRYEGQPVIDEEGNILYQFPSLQRTASTPRRGRKEYVGRRWTDFVGGVDKFFKEKKWQFSNTSITERAMVAGLGGLNLFGVIFLGAILKDTSIAPVGFIKFITGIFPLLQIYAGSFFAIPLFRWFIVLKTNADIEKRNQARQQRARALELPDLSLRQKLLSARDMAQRTFIGQDRIVYSTDRDLVEQDYEAQEWDKRFREIENSD